MMTVFIVTYRRRCELHNVDDIKAVFEKEKAARQYCRDRNTDQFDYAYSSWELE